LIDRKPAGANYDELEAGLMKTILICTVGGSLAPVVNAINQNKPDFVYFLCSKGQGPAASVKVVNEVTTREERGTCPNCGKSYTKAIPQEPITQQAGLAGDRYRIEAIEEPDDFGAVVAACESIGRHIKQTFSDEPVRVLANYTGGTKTMSLGLGVFVVIGRGLWELQVQAAWPRTDIVSVKSGDIAQVQDINIVLARETITRALELEQRTAARHG
jgi:hypothetical protein